MEDARRLSTLIADIYDAALDQARWPDVLRKAALFVGGLSASIYAKDAARKEGAIYHHDGGIDPDHIRLYFEKYVKLDPVTTGHYFAEIEEPVSTCDLIAYDELLETRFYKEWVKPQGIVDFINATLDRSTTSAAMFGVFRHERDGLVDDETRHRMRLIVPHIRRSVLVGRAIDLRKAEADTMADALDGLAAAMFMVDAAGKIVHANAAGHMILANGGPLRAFNGKLATSDTDTDRILRKTFAAVPDGDRAIGSCGIAVPLIDDEGEHHVAHVLPLTSGARRRAGTTYRAAVALFVHRAALDTPSLPEVIAKTYGLTPTELRVLLGIVEVGGVPEVAEALGIADTTVKTHLGRLYGKTGTSRQADLVKLVAGFASPLASEPRRLNAA